MAASHERSLGAQMERRAMRAYLRRQWKYHLNPTTRLTIDRILLWLDGRRKRYDRRPGGLGRR